MKKLKALCELPSWFNLEDYAYLRGLNATGWAQVMSALLWLGSDGVLSDLREFPEEVTVDEMFSESLLPSGADSYRRLWQGRYKTDPKTFTYRGVAALSNGVVAYMAREINAMPEAKFLLGNKNGIRAHTRLPKRYTDEQKRFADEPFFLTLHEKIVQRNDDVPLTNNRAISVNMDLPDAILLEDFKDWLKANRSLSFHKAAPKVFNHLDFAKWIDSQFVPYAILTFWARAMGAEITHNLMAAAIFPRHRLVTEANIRRTIRPAWEAWLCRETVEALHAQAAKEERQNLTTAPGQNALPAGATVADTPPKRTRTISSSSGRS
jgi:hypothetical protein